MLSTPLRLGTKLVFIREPRHLLLKKPGKVESGGVCLETQVYPVFLDVVYLD